MNRQQGGMWVVLAAGLFGSILGGSAARAVEYTITDLGTLGGQETYVYGINNAGQVVGASAIADGYYHAFVWQNGVMTDLGTLGGTYSWAHRINESGQVAGYSWTGGTLSQTHPVRWQNGTPHDLNVGGGSNLTQGVMANGINDAGQVVGTGPLSAFLWDNGQVTNLPFARAYAINNNGQVAGTVYTGQQDIFGHPGEQAVLWDRGNVIDLGASRGLTSWPTDMNDQGQVVGWGIETVSGGDYAQYGFLWEAGVVNEIPGPNGYSTRPLGVNNAGDIVGQWGSNDYRYGAFLRTAGVSVDLTTVLPIGSGWDLISAVDINDSGQIVGRGAVRGDAYPHAYILTPVPEPMTGVLVCVSVVLISRRKRCR